MLKRNSKRLRVYASERYRSCGYWDDVNRGFAKQRRLQHRGHLSVLFLRYTEVTSQGTVLSAVCDYIFLSFFIRVKQHREPSPDVVDVVMRGLFGAVIFRFCGNSKRLRVCLNATVRNYGYAQA